ncbi:hypothetical protein [Methylophilus sp. 5]|uniref:hypothetical protein n=1 Tax=Methylophilus sp. 5 TaxID=1112274 RepID=UPI000491670D|nr:hypothetical protein [Methylophilus sp. 5]
MHNQRLITYLLAASLGTSYADPPAHAPAHGWRKKHAPYYQGYSGYQWQRDYGVMRGECQWQTVGTVASVREGSNKPIAVILGSVIGAVIGNQIGKAIDNNDRGCIGHALELGRIGQPVHWVNPNNRVEYHLTPTADFMQGNQKCKSYRLEWVEQGKRLQANNRACLAE